MNKASKQCGCVSLVLVALLCICICISYKGRSPKVYIIHVAHDAPITQEIAVSVTKQALVKAGIDVKRMMPKPYKANNLFNPSEMEKFFSRDPHDPNNSGYVIWKRKDGAIYKVDIKRSTNKVECRITVIKSESPMLANALIRLMNGIFELRVLKV